MIRAKQKHYASYFEPIPRRPVINNKWTEDDTEDMGERIKNAALDSIGSSIADVFILKPVWGKIHSVTRKYK